MGERVRVVQKSDMAVRFFAADPEDEGADLQEASRMHQLTPYGMMLTSLASCTTIVLLTYAKAHGIGLEQATVHAEYERSFKEDCEHCEGDERYDERITESVELAGDLSGEEREKLEKVVKFCSIRRMLEGGIGIGQEEDIS